jgi:hypothetical protein
MKPEFLYHGSQYILENLIPKQAKDASKTGSQLGIYACEYPEEVIRFAIPIRWYPDNPTGRRLWSCLSEGRLVIEYGSIDPYGIGYIYKISSENFDKIDNWQWMSTKETPIIEATKIKVEDYWHLILFSEEALRVNKFLYPSDTLYVNK